MVKVQKRWRLGDTPVSLRLRYECPLEEVGRFYEPPARLLLRCALLWIWMIRKCSSSCHARQWAANIGHARVCC